MRKIKTTLLFVICFFAVSCNQAISKMKAKEKLEFLLHVPISSNFKITDYDISSDIHGTYTEEFYAHFSNDEFNKIFEEVRPGKVEYINNVYGITVTKGKVMISAIFFPDKYTIKYSYYKQ